MGMDVYGNNPTTSEGEYFRANVWWWHPLAEYVQAAYPELASDCEYWQSNDGDGLDATGSAALAAAIEADLANGRIAQYARDREIYLAALPTEECEFCKGTGVRTDEVGVKHGLDKPRDPVTGKGGCNACSGTGRREPWERNYGFSVEVMTEFATFLRDCGGFAIC